MLKKSGGDILLRTGRQIRSMRENAGMTPAELARKLHVSKEVMSSIEKGQQDVLLDMLLKIARIFGRRLKLSIVKRRRTL